MTRFSTAPHTLTGTHAATGNTWVSEHPNERTARAYLAHAICDNGYGNKAYATAAALSVKTGEPLIVSRQGTETHALTAIITRTT